jgi:poly(3-hydroxybutyrate) depolymerase
MGYVAGGLIAGLLADAIDLSAAIALVAALTAASGLWVAVDFHVPRRGPRQVARVRPGTAP